MLTGPRNAGTLIRLAGLVIILLFSGSAPAVQAKTHSPLIEKRKGQLHSIQLRLQAVRKRLHEANLREREASRQLHQVQGKLHVATDKMNHYSTELRLTSLNLVYTKQRLSLTEERYNQEKLLLADRLTGISIYGKTSFFDFLFGARNFSDLLDRLHFLDLIVDQDLALARSTQLEKNKITKQKILLGREYQQVSQIRNQEKREYQAYYNITEERKNLLNQVEFQRSQYARHEIELEEISAKLEKELEELVRREQEKLRAAHHVFHNVGILEWPVGSHFITSSFGWRLHPLLGTQKFHTGVDIASAAGTPIRAAADGVVIYTGWYGGYGEAVVIDHGNDLSTLYAHCSSIYVSKGQSVSRGEVIAAVGSTGYSTGPHLHFEVRENGTPVDPMGRF